MWRTKIPKKAKFYFFCLFSDREKGYHSSFLFIGGSSSLMGEGIFVCGALIHPLEGVSSNSFFLCLVNPSPLRYFVYASMWRMIIPNKIKFFIWLVLHGRVNTLDLMSRRMSSLMGSWCSILWRKIAEDLDHLLWSFDFAYAMWTFFFDKSSFFLARQHDYWEMIEEFLLYPSFSEKGKFLCLARVYCFLGSLGWKEQ